MTKLDITPILFTYPISVNGRRVDWYLTLRGIPYLQCNVRDRLPRPDITDTLNIKYRRIPILAIGRDIYIDSRLIIEKLEKLLPEDPLGSKNPFEQGLERILQTWTMDGGPFWRTSQCIPAALYCIQDKAWTDDRYEMTGIKYGPEDLTKGRPEALAHQRLHFETIEHGLMADGRKFILNGTQPTLADLHAIWTFDWAVGESMDMGKALEADDCDGISETRYPKTYAWIARFRRAVDQARQEKFSNNNNDNNGGGGSGSDGQQEITTIEPEEATRRILREDFWEKESTVDELDPLKLAKGQVVEVWAIESGFNHRDRGVLVSLCTREIVIASQVGEGGDGYLRLHFPRTNFRIQPVVVQ